MNYKSIDDSYLEEEKALEQVPGHSGKSSRISERLRSVIQGSETEPVVQDQADSDAKTPPLPLNSETEQKTMGKSTRMSGSTRASGNELPEDFSVDDARDYHQRSGEPFYADEIAKFDAAPDDPEMLSRMFLPEKPAIQDTERMRRRSRLTAIANGLGMFADAIAGSKGAWLIPSKDNYEAQEQRADAIDSRNSQLSTEYLNAVSKAKSNYRRLLEAGAARQAKAYQNYKTQKYSSTDSISEDEYERISDNEKRAYTYDRSANRYVKRSSNASGSYWYGSSRKDKPYAAFELPDGDRYVFTDDNFYDAGILFTAIARDPEFSKHILTEEERTDEYRGKIENIKTNPNRLIEAFKTAIEVNPDKFYEHAAKMGLIKTYEKPKEGYNFDPRKGNVDMYQPRKKSKSKGEVDAKLKLN